MQSKQKDTSNTPSNGDEIHNKSSNLIEHIEIADTPFHITGNEETKYFLRLGDYRLTTPGQTKEECMNKVEKLNWYMITNVIAAMIDTAIKYDERLKK